jgi:hypothetical protein
LAQDGDSTLDIIQRLSNERQQLYRQKWPRRQAQAYVSQIRSLDTQIQSLWHQHRVELVQDAKPVNVRFVPIGRGDYRSSVEATAVRNMGEAEPAQPVTQLADALDQLGLELVREVLAELRAERERNQDEIPLRKVLARQGKTLQWTDGGRGRAISRVVNISSPS